MMFLRDYLRVLLPLVLMFAIYHLVIVPLVEPPKTKQPIAKWIAPAIPDREEWWESSFPEGAWQRNHPRIVKTENAILLFQTREAKSKTRWLFKPLTILIPQSGSGAEPKAIVIQNSTGAEIEFKSAVEWSKEIPPIESGHLLGEITIDSPADESAKRGGMHIDARDLRINKRQIWTHQPIHMMIGNSRIDGRELLIQLDRDLLTSEPDALKDDSPFNGLDFLQLFYVDRVQIALNNGGLWPSKDDAEASQRRAHATLKCGGSFVFQFHQSKAIVQNDVHMEHHVEGMPIDTFDCQELQLQIGWNHSQSTRLSSSGASAALATGSSNWKVDRLEAFGALGKDNHDFSKWIKLDAPSIQSEAQGQYLAMDFLAGSVQLSNRLPDAAAREFPRVYLKKDAIQVWSPEVHYWSPETVANSMSLSPQSMTARSNRLGALLASGGVAQMDSKNESWKLSWSKKLRIKPDQNDLTKDLVIIEGSANVSSPSIGRFLAEEMHLWLSPMTNELAAKLAPRYPDGKIPQFLPDRMHALGEVVVNSPQLQARVEDMKIWFAYLDAVATQDTPHNAATPAVGQMHSNTGLQLSASSGPPPSPLLQPTQPARPSSFSSNVVSQSSPLNVTGKVMQARVVSSGTKAYVDNLQLDGSFSLTKDQASDTSPWPFVATGQTLNLRQTHPDVTDITITGEPNRDAKVKLGSGWVQAQELRLMQSANEFWIDHPGEAVIPLEAMQRSRSPSIHSLVSVPNTSGGFTPALASTKTQDEEVIWRELPHLRWGRRMKFDGRIAKFDGGVTIDCRVETNPSTLWHVLCSADEMNVEMLEPVSLRENSGVKANPSQVSVIRLQSAAERNVDVRLVQTDHQNNRRSTEHLRLPKIEFFVPTQELKGEGPGELWSRRLANTNPLQAGFASQPAKESLRDSEPSLQCIHLSFMGGLNGNLAHRTATFFNRVAALMGPIPNWDGAVDVHNSERLRNNQTRLNADRLSIFDGSGLSWNQPTVGSRTTTNPTAWEVEAQGSANLESLTERGELNVEADSLKYHAANDVVRISGTARQPAVITHAVGSNEPPMTTRLNSAAIRLKTGEIEGMQIQSIGGSLPAHMQRAGNQPAGSPGSRNQTNPVASPNDQLPSPRPMSILPRQR
ncbi:MAG: hypothetical protein ABL921_09990 [Pirellula sp.]